MSVESKIIYCAKPEVTEADTLYYKTIDFNNGIQAYGKDFIVDCTYWNRSDIKYQYLSELIGDENCPLNILWDSIKKIMVKYKLCNDNIKQYLDNYIKDAMLNKVNVGNVLYNKENNIYAVITKVDDILLRTVPKYVKLTKEPKFITVRQILWDSNLTGYIKLKSKKKRTSDYDILYQTMGHAIDMVEQNTKEVIVILCILLITK